MKTTRNHTFQSAIFAAAFALIAVPRTSAGQSAGSCQKALSAKTLNAFTGKTFAAIPADKELPCLGDCICKTAFTAGEGKASIRISNDPGRKEYKSVLAMTPDATAFAEGDWTYVFSSISTGPGSTREMSIVLYYSGKTYFVTMPLIREEGETKAFLIGVLKKALAAV